MGDDLAEYVKQLRKRSECTPTPKKTEVLPKPAANSYSVQVMQSLSTNDEPSHIRSVGHVFNDFPRQNKVVNINGSTKADNRHSTPQRKVHQTRLSSQLGVVRQKSLTGCVDNCIMEIFLQLNHLILEMPHMKKVTTI